ncbi:MAG: histidine--tRNA ligase [Candidatus Kaiserbacteria bacterium]|nr:histidine--tRNA ligase [Candidatus Kaiserbacteria bacterium]
MTKKLSTEAYKGTRDFYPEDMAIQRYIFDTWAKTAESFGFERYDASILEPSELYRSKGAENEELVNEQTYTFTDRGDREVTLRPEMTPTVARMVAGKRRDLSFPVRWYSIPNLFRYERPQRGRLREHWQLNCDMFGIDHYSADIEMIALAYSVLKAFGAKDEDFEIHINDRSLMNEWYKKVFGLTEEQIVTVTHIVDRKNKVSATEFKAMLSGVVTDQTSLIKGLSATDPHTLITGTPLTKVLEGLKTLGITNVVFDATIARGFNYYTGTVFEVFDTSGENNRSMMGGGRYDNLTELFGGEAITGMGFGMGDVIMRDFLETHKLLPKNVHVTAPTLTILPMDESTNIEAEKIAQQFRTAAIRTSVDRSNTKIGKKLSSASDAGTEYVLVVGSDEIASQTFTLKELKTKKETSGSISELIRSL